jgi:hypothetical protein
VEQWLRELAPCVDQRREEAELARRAEEAERARAEESWRKREAAAREPREIDRGRPFRIAGIAAAGAGLVGLGLGLGYSIHGSNLKAELADACRAGCDWEVLRGKDAAGARANKIAAAGWIGGGVAAAGGVALYLYGRSRIEHVQVAPVQGGAAVSARLSF